MRAQGVQRVPLLSEHEHSMRCQNQEIFDSKKYSDDHENGQIDTDYGIHSVVLLL